MNPRTLAAVLLLAAFLPCPARAAEEPSDKEIKAALASPDSHLRNAIWKRLNPENATQYKVLLQVLKQLSWHDREGAILSLATAATEETLKKMLKDMKDNKDPAVRQGLAKALVKMDDEKYYAQVFEGLKDKNPTVRRVLVQGLGITKKHKDKVTALVEAFQQEKDPVVRSFFVTALDDQTRAFRGPDPTAWYVWWEVAKNDKSYELGKTDEEAEKAAEEIGNKMKESTTQYAGVTLQTSVRGKGVAVPILILPEYGHSKEVMIPFLAELEKTHKLFYIDLPEIKSFPPNKLKTISDANIPFYPIDLLVEAFEELRKATGQERFAIMACGFNGWIAMRYASLYPKSVSHMVLIGPISSNKAYGDATDRMERQGKDPQKNDVELWHLSMTRKFDTRTGQSVHDQYHEKEQLPKPEGEDASLDRRNWSLYFKDDRDSIIGILYPKMHRELGSVAIPDFKCFSEPRRNIPTLVIAGRGSILSSVDDCKEIAKHYGGQLFIYENSSMMPFCEESELFNKHMAALLREAVKKSIGSKAKKKVETPKKKEKADGSEKPAP